MPRYEELNDGYGSFKYCHDEKCDTAIVVTGGLTVGANNSIATELTALMRDDKAKGFDLISLGFHNAESFHDFCTASQLDYLATVIDGLAEFYSKIIVVSNSYSSLAAVQLANSCISAIVMVSPSFIVDGMWEHSNNKPFLNEKGQIIPVNFDHDVPIAFSEKFLEEGLSMDEAKVQSMLNACSKPVLVIWGEDDMHYQIANNAELEFPDSFEVRKFKGRGHSLADPNWRLEVAIQVCDFIVRQ